MVLVAVVSTAKATPLMYETFDLAPGQSLDGFSGAADAVGMFDVWRVGGDGTMLLEMSNGDQVIARNLNPGPLWKGVSTSVPQGGRFVDSAAALAYSMAGTANRIAGVLTALAQGDAGLTSLVSRSKTLVLAFDNGGVGKGQAIQFKAIVT